MRWNELCRFLGNRPIQILRQSAPEDEIDALRCADGDTLIPGDGVLLCCRYWELSCVRWQEEAACSLLLLLPNGGQVDAAQWQCFRNVAALSDEAAYNEVIIEARQLLREFRVMERAHHRLLELITQNRSLTELANEIARIYGHYSDIVDNSLNILAISEAVRPPVENLLKDHKSRYVKPNVVQYLRTSGNLTKMQSSHLPVLVEDAPRNTYAYSVAIGAGSINLGYLCVFISPGERLSPVHLHFLPDTARLLSLEMQKSRSDLLSKSTYFTRLLSDMLAGRSTADSTFEERFSAFNYELRRWKNIIVLHLDAAIPASTDLHILCRTLQSLLGNCIYMVQEEYIVFLVSRHHAVDIPEAQLTEWAAYMSSNRLRIGISDSFESPLAAGAHWEQARTALSLGQRFYPGEWVHRYQQLRLLALADKLAAHDDLRLYCFPPLLRLMEVDAAEGGGLTDTLRRYMNSGLSAADTCRELFIHRNTLYYRLSKIRDIMGCDFTHPDNAAQITLTFALLRYLGKGGA